MNNNWESLIRAIVPLSFMAIWALTSLFNRDSKPKPPLRSPLRPELGPNSPRPGEPTLRWNTPNTAGPSTIRPQAPRPPVRVGGDDGIVILAADDRRNERDAASRSSLAGGLKRPTKGKPVVPPRKVETPTTRSRLAGVNQNVNQHLTNATIEMTPISSMPPMSSMPLLGLNSAPSLAPPPIADSPLSAAAMALGNPAKIREAFLLNEILQPPVSMRKRRIGPSPQ